MKPETISALHDFALKARELLEREAREQLEGIYGFLPDGKLGPPQKYRALKELSEAQETRRHIEHFLDDEKSTGITPREVRERLVKETAFTWLNRLVAFNMMETRNLIRQAVSKGTQSNGFLRWLTEKGNEKDYEKYEQGDLPQNLLGEGPRQEAYRHFLLWQCTQLAREIKVLFDPEILVSRLFPRPGVLGQIIEAINAAELADAWAPGNEETIGWVYQYFNSEELEEAFREVRLTGKKFEAKDIPSVTQLFTPRWIVRYLVENTLGRLWIQMHPDTKIADQLTYLVPIESWSPIPFKPVKEIRLLDPACGTMHFGLVAFDVFILMYREEIERASTSGWPEKPSVEREERIPAAIVANNLFGIDIDLRAVQLSALTLYLKAKSLNPNTKLMESKLTPASIHMLDGDRMTRFVSEIERERPILKRILVTLHERLKDSEQLGSLLRLEQEIRSLIEKERERFDREGRQFDMYRKRQEYDKIAVRREFWESLEEEIIQALNSFVRSQKEKGFDQSFFAGEATRGLRLLETLSETFDVVVTNPPYMARGKMNPKLKGLVSIDYAEAKSDLYAAFIQRCLELAGEHGFVGMLTMHTFMFLSSYEKLRSWITGRAIIKTLAHLGPGFFSVGNPGTLQTVAHVLFRESESKKREQAEGVYFRLTNEIDCESKQKRFEAAVRKCKSGEKDAIVFQYCQTDFNIIPGGPWVYWITSAVRRLFETLPKMGEIAPGFHGTTTYDNFRFIRFWWEVGRDRVAFGLKEWPDFERSNKAYVPCMKGGPFLKWYGNQEYVLQLLREGKVLIEFLNAKHDQIRARDYIFKKGLTWNKVASGRLSFRISPGGFIFADAGISAFPVESSLIRLIGILNSSIISHILSYISPTINYEVGHIAKLPVPDISSPKLHELANKAILLSEAWSTEKETNFNFITPPNWHTGIKDTEERRKDLAEAERQIDEEVYRLYEISGKDRRSVEAEFVKGNSQFENVEEPAEEEELDQGNGDSLIKEELAKRWISYAVGIVIGRFEPGNGNGLGTGQFSNQVANRLQDLADPDGILVMDEGHKGDLPIRILEALNVMLGEAAAPDVVKTATGREGPAEEVLRQYLERSFFKEHIQKYRKRPVYWFLQSPRKKYGIWIFHEKLTSDTLFRIKTEYVVPKINLLESQIAELRKKRDGLAGREKRQMEKEIAELTEILDDVREFLKRLNFIIEERKYVPHIDDGILLNMAPLWELIPSWQAEPKNAWEALEKGNYDWAHQAMDHWPDRVKEKCKTNKSFAIAHGLA